MVRCYIHNIRGGEECCFYCLGILAGVMSFNVQTDENEVL